VRSSFEEFLPQSRIVGQPITRVYITREAVFTAHTRFAETYIYATILNQARERLDWLFLLIYRITYRIRSVLLLRHTLLLQHCKLGCHLAPVVLSSVCLCDHAIKSHSEKKDALGEDGFCGETGNCTLGVKIYFFSLRICLPRL